MNYPTWAKTPAMRDYYANYWGKPVYGEDALYGLFCLEIFQAGLSWSTVWQKRAALEGAFANFEIAKVAEFDEEQVAELQGNLAIIRNRQKIMACIHNAQLLMQLHRQGQYLTRLLWATFDGKVCRMVPDDDGGLPATVPAAEELSKQLKKLGFKFAGPKVVFSLLCAAGIVNGRLAEE